MLETINPYILIISILVLVSITASIVSLRFGAPLLLLFLIIGFLAGEDGIGNISFDDASLAYLIGTIALVVILFDSGFLTKKTSVKNAFFPASILATLGVVSTAFLVGVVVKFLLGFSWPLSFLLGAIVSSTDAAAVFFLLRAGGIRIKDKVKSVLEIESGSNDPMAVLLTLFFVEMVVSSEEQSFLIHLLNVFTVQMGIGFILGFLGAHVIVKTVNLLKVDIELYPLIVLSLVFILFTTVSMLGGSGFLAVYVAGIIVGNTKMRVGGMLHRFQGVVSCFCQILMFLTLGLLATPSLFATIVIPAVIIALFLIFIARPIAVWLLIFPFKFKIQEINFIAWVGLRGAVSILLAIVPMIYGIEQGIEIFNITFIIVLTSLLVQGWSIIPMAKKLRLTVPKKLGAVERVELDLPSKIDLELVTYRINNETHVTSGGKLPRWAKPSIVIREGKVLSAYTAGELKEKDRVYIFASNAQLPILDKFFAQSAEEEKDDSSYFKINHEKNMVVLAKNYGIKVKKEYEETNIAEYIEKEIGENIEIGDSISLGNIELIVKKLSEENKIQEVGLFINDDEFFSILPLTLVMQKIVKTLKLVKRKIFVKKIELE